MVWGDSGTEGSETTKSGTDEQKRHMRLMNEDKQVQRCNVLRLKHRSVVDAAEDSQTNEGLNVKQLQISNGVLISRR